MMSAIRGIATLAVGRRSQAADKAGQPQAGDGKELAGLTGAVQMLLSFAVMLPVMGGVVLLVEYLTVPTIPAALAFSESPGGLVWRGWLVLLIAIGPLLAVGLFHIKNSQIKLIAAVALLVLAVVLAVATPFPHVAVSVMVTCVLAAWFLARLGRTASSSNDSAAQPLIVDLPPGTQASRSGPSTAAVALSALVGGIVAVLALGLTPSSGQPVYVVAAPGDALKTGWYIQLTDSSDPVYLLTCSGDEVIAAPKDHILLRTYAAGQLWNVSLLQVVSESKPLPPLGLTPTCPSAPPPAT
jgi:hypothetical protein